jgi:L-alanine-DL-glutamate epimerase-like enolase superfamily enzyme
MTTIACVRTYVFRYPLATPVLTSFGAMHDRPAVLVQIEDSDGAQGWGEVWCNFPQCGAEHRARLVDGVIAPKLLGCDPENPAGIFHKLDGELRVLALQTAEFGPLAQSLAGVDIALWDLAARRAGVPLRTLLDSGAGSVVPVYASGIHPGVLGQSVTSARAAGYRAYKLKVGFDAEGDLTAAMQMRGLLQAGERMMLDANQAWDMPTATRMVRVLAECAPDWLEEPVAADTPWDAWQELAGASTIALAAGENVRGARDFQAAIGSRALKVVQPDMCKWGGFSGCLPVARKVIAAGLTYCPHYLGAGIGLIASAQLLAAAGGDGLLEVDCNPNPLRELLAQPFPQIRNGCMQLSPDAGLGVAPALDAVLQWQCFSTESSH